MVINIIKAKSIDSKTLEKLTLEFLKSNDRTLFDTNNHVFKIRKDAEMGKSDLDASKILKGYTDRIHSKGYLIKENDALIDYVVIRDKIDLKKWKVNDLPAEIRFAFLKPNYETAKMVKNELEKFLSEHYN
ncbi:hypothetical protein COV11_00240 [Candidatus Woesearchaeota archaeon CG10_big_fil_rev_8_21_14_0_10_30_7]|nr:MAG: hypothetical protein COV11_00240 [Candidatus Woesearchaeota archaeon CG10_big_fil_rev_8_21_14_0_10_30_7]